LSHVDGLPPGWARLFSRVAALVPVPFLLTMLRSGAGGYAFFALAAILAYESNCHRVPVVVRRLALVMQVLGLLGFVALAVTMALFAESGHRGYEYMSGLLWLLLLGLLFVGVVATVGALGTLATRGA
jgi:hypothetical protein